MRVKALLFGTILALAGAQGAIAADAQGKLEAFRKLHALGYPSDNSLAIQRWRSDNRREEKGDLTENEIAALVAQSLPESLGAMTGNPFTGMGLAMGHKTREEAEREAIALCKANGGDATCANPLVVRAEQCVAMVGYSVTVARRPTYRTSVGVSTDLQRALNGAKEGCTMGASHPALCRPLLTYCGDGREFKIFETNSAAVGSAR